MSDVQLEEIIPGALAVINEQVKLFTPAPIPIADLKRKFKEDIEFCIDYKNSKFKDKVLITYLSNLDLKCRICLEDVDESLKLVEAYMRHPAMAKIDDLIDVVINILLAYTGKPNTLAFDPTMFIRNNRDIVDVWMKRVASLYLFAFYTDPYVDKGWFNEWPLDEDVTMAGVNYVHLIGHPLFHLLIDDLPAECFTYNPFFFKEYVFAGNNLYGYFAIPENPLYMAVVARRNLAPEDYQRLISNALETIDVPLTE